MWAEAIFTKEDLEEVTGQLFPLRPVKLKSGKTVHAWAIEGDLDPAAVRSNTFTMEWPLKSGKMTEFPEVDIPTRISSRFPIPLMSRE